MGLIWASLASLRVSWEVLEDPFDVLGRPLGILGDPCGPSEVSLGYPGVPGASLGGPRGVLGEEPKGTEHT